MKKTQYGLCQVIGLVPANEKADSFVVRKELSWHDTEEQAMIRSKSYLRGRHLEIITREVNEPVTITLTGIERELLYSVLSAKVQSQSIVTGFTQINSILDKLRG